MAFVCGPNAAPGAALRVLSGLADCCYGAVTDGPLGCTCWTVDHDLEQADEVGGAPVGDREAMCADCAFRPDSPERAGSADVANASLGDLLALPNFYCHQGARRAVRYRHRLGVVVEAGPDGADYRPPIVDRDGSKVPLRADGTPLDRCAGWTAHHRPPAMEVEWDEDETLSDATLWGGVWAQVSPAAAGAGWEWKVLRSDDGHSDVIEQGEAGSQDDAKRQAVAWAWEQRDRLWSEHFATVAAELRG